MIIRPLERTDDLTAVADLIYETDKFLFSFLFGKRDKAVKYIEALITCENNTFSHRYIYCAVDASLVGILTAFPYRGDDVSEEEKDYLAVFSLPRLMIMWAKSILIRPLLKREGRDELYIQNLSIVPEARGRGIGSRLLAFAADLARENGCAALSLDVSIENDGARRLYESRGFSAAATGRLFFSKNYGVIRMRAPLKE